MHWHGVTNATSWYILEELLKLEQDECILWPRPTQGGYGRIMFNGKKINVHRVALWLKIGPPPEDRYHAAHDPLTCSSKLCINYRHLRWATPLENNQDHRWALL